MDIKARTHYNLLHAIVILMYVIELNNKSIAMIVIWLVEQDWINLPNLIPYTRMIIAWPGVKACFIRLISVEYNHGFTGHKYYIKSDFIRCVKVSHIKVGWILFSHSPETGCNSTCKNGGVCVDAKCYCATGYTGNECEYGRFQIINLLVFPYTSFVLVFSSCVSSNAFFNSENINRYRGTNKLHFCVNHIWQNRDVYADV